MKKAIAALAFLVLLPLGQACAGARLFVGNLSFSTTREAVEALFASAGRVTLVTIVIDRVTGQPRGFAFVTMASQAEADNAISQLNGTSFEGRILRVSMAPERPAGLDGDGRREGGVDGGGPVPTGSADNPETLPAMPPAAEAPPTDSAAKVTEPPAPPKPSAPAPEPSQQPDAAKAEAISE